MKILCKYSGIPFVSSPHFSNLILADVHPLFKAKPEVLFSHSYLIDWNTGKLTEEERKLLFLAILNSTELVDFHRPAEPSKQVVLYNFEELLKIASWIHDTRQYLYIGEESLPRFSVNDATYDLVTISGWLLAVESCKETRQRNRIKRQSREHAMNNIGSLEKIVRKHYNGQEVPRMNKDLAKWGFDLAGLSKNETTVDANGKQIPLRDFWTDLFCTPDSEVYGIDKKDMKELVEFCELEIASNMSNSSSFSTVRKQFFDRLYFLQNIVTATLGDFGFSVIDFDNLTIEEREEKELEEDIKRETLFGPEPKAEDFEGGSKSLDYKIAKAKWNSLLP